MKEYLQLWAGLGRYPPYSFKQRDTYKWQIG